MCTTSFISRTFSKGVKIELTTNIDIENNRSNTKFNNCELAKLPYYNNSYKQTNIVKRWITK